MFTFIKNTFIGGGDSNQAQSSQRGQSDGNTSTNDSRSNYEDNKRLTEFILENFPTLGNRRFAYLQRKEPNELQAIDISIYFADKDKYIVNENNVKKVIFSEFTYLPKEDLQVDDVMMRVEILEKYNKVLDQILQKSAAKHYDKFQEGIMNLDFFHTTSVTCMDNVNGAKKDLSLMQGDLVKRSTRIIKLFKQKIKKQKAIKFLRRFKERFGGIYKVVNALDNEEFSNAYEIIPIIKNAKEEFESNAEVARSFECLKNCEDYLDAKFDKLQARVRTGLEVIFSEWDEKKFEAYLKYFFMTEECYPTIPALSGQIEDILKSSIKIGRDKAVSLYLYGTNLIPQMRSKMKQASEAAKQLSRDAYPKFISRVFYEVSLVMYNIDLACKYLQEKSEDGIELILENKKTYQLRDYLTQIKNTLLRLRKGLWQIIQKKLAKLLLKNQICEFNYNDLMTFLRHCNGFFEIGQDFSHSSSKIPNNFGSMRETIIQILKDYYTSFHESNITSLKFFISNEKWRRLPLPSNYKEPKLMNLLSNFPKDNTDLSALFGNKLQNQSNLEEMSLEEIMKKNSALSSFIRQNPFQIERKPKPVRAMTTLLPVKDPDMSIDDINEHDTTMLTNGGSLSLDKKNSDYKPVNLDESEVVVCPASDMVVKSFETYVLLLNLLRTHSFEIFTGLMTAFDLYVEIVIDKNIHGVVNTFVLSRYLTDLLDGIDLEFVQRYKEEERFKALEACHELYLFQTSYKGIKNFLAKLRDKFESYKLKIPTPQDHSASGNMLINMGERIIATESILFIFNHLKYIQTKLPILVKDPSELQTINEFYDSYNQVIPVLRDFIYFHNMPSFLRHNTIFQSIENVRWEVQGKQEFSNIYTDRIIYLVKDLFELVECLAGGGIPKKVQEYIKAGIFRAVLEQLAESYSKVKKINDQGREIMLADFKLISNALIGLVDPSVNAVVDKNEKYIQAWNLNPNELKEFIVTNKELYSLRTLHGLLLSHNLVKSFNKQQRRELMKDIENDYVAFIRENMY